MHPYIFSWHGFELGTYGLMVAAGYLMAIWYVWGVAKKAGLESGPFWDLVTWIILGAIAGGKILYVLLSDAPACPRPLCAIMTIIKDFRYGFVFFGGLLGGFAAAVFYVKKHGLAFWRTADSFAPAIALGHAFGRTGCFMAGCCYGRPADGPVSVVFSDTKCLVSPQLLGVPLHPVQLYEAGANFLLFIVLHFMLKRKSSASRQGAALLCYAAGYSLIRFICEYFRGDDRGGFLLGLSPSQNIALGIMAICAASYKFLPAGGSSREK